MLGSMLKEGPAFYAVISGGTLMMHPPSDYAIILLQAFLSSSAGIFSEKLLKQPEVNPHDTYHRGFCHPFGVGL
ncbi:hypothetical protein FOL47_007514 [Perkinsus chesapeaki]|uniref:Uncharacterized protein n=1 Tax=Perkinsus chesapeaki TaxID=330153 RepID=A0A7J6LJY5_PERCH|nr:hypothetical protein FOL47_007514 [Perkinsus chesapeaki]